MTEPMLDREPAPLRPALGVLRQIRDSLVLFFSRFGQIYLPALVGSAVLGLFNRGMTPSAPVGEDGAPMITFAFYPDVVLGLASLLVSFFMIGYLCLASLDAAMGRTHPVGTYGQQVLRRLAPIGVLGLVVSVISALGFLALVLPGLYLVARFLPWVEATVFEDKGWSGLTRAQDLTEGYRWPLVGAILAMIVIAILGVAIVMLLGAPPAGAATASPAITLLLDAVVNAFSYSVGAVFTAVVYLRLRELREGKSISDIAATIG